MCINYVFFAPSYAFVISLDPQDSETAAAADSKHELLLQHADACRRYADGSRGSMPAAAGSKQGAVMARLEFNSRSTEMEVSWNGDSPQSSIWLGFDIINQQFWDPPWP